MRPALIMLPLALLVACATPREQCINEVTRDTRVLSSLINQGRGNLERGYALEEREDTRVIRDRCERRTEDGEVFTFRGDKVRTFTTVVPVAINLDAERAKLQSLEERFAQTQSTSNQRVAQCIATYPE